MSRFIEGEDRGQSALLPASLEDYVGEHNPVRIFPLTERDANSHFTIIAADQTAMRNGRFWPIHAVCNSAQCGTWSGMC